MKYGVAFQIVFVAIVVNLTVKRVGVNPQVSDTEGFKNKAERFRVKHQIVRADA